LSSARPVGGRGRIHLLYDAGDALFVQLFEQPVIDFALAGVLRHQVPEVADFGLTDAVDAAEALFQTVGVPG